MNCSQGKERRSQNNKIAKPLNFNSVSTEMQGKPVGMKKPKDSKMARDSQVTESFFFFFSLLFLVLILFQSVEASDWLPACQVTIVGSSDGPDYGYILDKMLRIVYLLLCLSLDNYG